MTEVRRVLMVVTAPQRRGAEIFARDLAGALESAAVDVRTAYLFLHEDEPLPVEDDDVLLSSGGGGSTSRWPIFDPTLVLRLWRLIRDFEPDIVQVNGGSTVKYGALVRRLSRKPWRLVYRNIGDPRIWMRGRVRPAFYRVAVFSRVDGLVSVGRETLAGHQEIFGDHIPAIHIPRSVDNRDYVARRDRHEVRSELGSSHDAPVTLFIGALSPEKRLDRLLRVHRGVRAQLPEAVLWIAGSGPEEAAIRKLVNEFELETSVVLLGTRSDVADLLGGADLVALTSDTEGVPGVVLEAGLCQRPVVATNVGGVASCLVDGKTGRLVDVDDEDGFVQAVVDLLTDEQKRLQFGEEARRLVAEEFALEAARDRYLQFYEQILNGDAP